uniref:Uncharacterized protein n=1 Tax=Apteryx owenii TaxID=8824 RepID=A0A8B9Q6B9_APTOW
MFPHPSLHSADPRNPLSLSFLCWLLNPTREDALSRLETEQPRKMKPPYTFSSSPRLPPQLPNSGKGSCPSLRERLQDIMKKMDQNLEFINAMDNKLTALSVHMYTLEGLITSLDKSTAQMDSLIQRHKDEMQKCVQALEHLMHENRCLTTRVEQLERQVPASSLRILGLPEGEEGKDLVGFLEQWLPRVLHLDTREEPIVVKRAFRVGNGRQRRGSEQCRNVIVCVGNVGVKDRILQQVRKLKSITYKRKEILIVPDVGHLPPGKRRHSVAVKNLSFPLQISLNIRRLKQRQAELCKCLSGKCCQGGLILHKTICMKHCFLTAWKDGY